MAPNQRKNHIESFVTYFTLINIGIYNNIFYCYKYI